MKHRHACRDLCLMLPPWNWSIPVFGRTPSPKSHTGFGEGALPKKSTFTSSRHDRLQQLTLSVSFVEKCVGDRWLTSNVTWTPTFRKQQLAGKGLSQRVQNHNQHRVARIEPVFCQYSVQYAPRCNVTRSPYLQQRMHRKNAT